MSDVLEDLRGEATDCEDTAPNLSLLLSRAVAEIERLREATRWRSVAEEPPKDGHQVIASSHYRLSTGEWERDSFVADACKIGDAFKFETETGFYDATHWQPLPEPPK